jgi:hypothetical protein
MTTNTFSKLEADIMKVLTKNPGLFLSQYKIYNQILENYEMKDPIEKDNFKFRFLAVLRQMSSLFNGVSIMKRDDVIYTGFEIETDKNQESEYSYSDMPQDKEKNGEMPSEMAVINFIIDEDMDNYLSRTDYKGNSILHSLVIVSDLERIKKCFSKLEGNMEKKNKDGYTPVDLISDFKISNFFMNIIFQKFKEQEMEYDYLLKKCNFLTKIIDESNKSSNLFYYFIILAFFVQIFIILFK